MVGTAEGWTKEHKLALVRGGVSGALLTGLPLHLPTSAVTRPLQHSLRIKVLPIRREGKKGEGGEVWWLGEGREERGPWETGVGREH